MTTIVLVVACLLCLLIGYLIGCDRGLRYTEYWQRQFELQRHACDWAMRSAGHWFAAWRSACEALAEQDDGADWWKTGAKEGEYEQ